MLVANFLNSYVMMIMIFVLIVQFFVPLMFRVAPNGLPGCSIPAFPSWFCTTYLRIYGRDESFSTLCVLKVL